MNSKTLNFPEGQFQQDVKSKLKMLDDVMSKGQEIVDMGAPKAGLLAREHMIDAHLSLADEVDQFMPAGKSAEYIASFKANMSAVSTALKKQATQLEESLKEFVTQTTALSNRNKSILLNAGDRTIVNSSLSEMILMERGAK